MTVFVRKLNKMENIEIIKQCTPENEITADAVTHGEFKTKQNTLSVWQTDDENLEMGILAIALSSSKIEAMDFIVFNEHWLAEEGLKIIKSDPGINPLKKAREMHYDISNLKMQDLAKLVTLYTKAASDDNNIKNYSKSELETAIKEAATDGLIDSSQANSKVKTLIENLTA